MILTEQNSKFKNGIPNPQFVRKQIMCLNGLWDFSMGGKEKQKINVPYCPEAALSGIEYTDFIKACTYERTFLMDEVLGDSRVVIHFGAVDYKSQIFVNDIYVGGHEGGFTPFEVDCTNAVHAGENLLRVEVFDDINANVPSGKQSHKRQSFGCFYTRVTGIWQDVWIEKTPKNYIRCVKFFPNIHNASVDVEVSVEGEGYIEIQVLYEGREVGNVKSDIAFKNTFSVNLSEKHLWEPGNGRLYDVKLIYGTDEVESYFGLREVKFEGEKFLVNGKSVFQRFVLDQGYNPQGLYTTPNDEAMVADIEKGIRLGFNGARLHQKVFEPRFLYHCDKMGYMVWGEFPSWGIKYDNLESLGIFIREWVEAVERDFNHPSIVLWCPLNEVWKDWFEPKKTRDVRYIDSLYDITKNLDPTRPCVDVSGGFHGHRTDLYDFHCYEEYQKLENHIRALENESVLDVPLLYDEKETHLRYRDGYPVNASEYGGIRFSKTAPISEVETINECVVDSEESWGYGKGEVDEDAFVQRYEALTKLLLKCPRLSGFCYTQLYDVEQEENGFFTYDRQAKLSESMMERIAQCNKQIAEIEK